jgi:hypothetical protein
MIKTKPATAKLEVTERSACVLAGGGVAHLVTWDKDQPCLHRCCGGAAQGVPPKRDDDGLHTVTHTITLPLAGECCHDCQEDMSSMISTTLHHLKSQVRNREALPMEVSDTVFSVRIRLCRTLKPRSHHQPLQARRG